ncbi:hypothetical protein Veis_2681 [Verminephrobacter eiseniae EF01-2]|uniref:Uncharacterized protein n=1 Tax=Verminephrobacter eiseniae (strain EF01-2) TaxID=391735 RepID=A1WLB6_VEREI|nr:hypothetical protein Veis_2681 [Verminephrobacter eiseniae EF01-2]MCW5284001.1 hypothetical protein [Verminephrobacter eiseniae]MCW5301709.1 hypothetical protein [Verminephrobacter eiseniae]MCW8180830.1 hypothetical protein [Verminephrobacter eiseniae]MCW8190389.1 hypothetical protein [Verminephrobacter eiseniae]
MDALRELPGASFGRSGASRCCRALRAEGREGSRRRHVDPCTHWLIRSDQIWPEYGFWCTAGIGWITGHTCVACGPLAAGATRRALRGLRPHVHARPNADRSPLPSAQAAACPLKARACHERGLFHYGFPSRPLASNLIDTSIDEK